ncbi:MAG: hypothetical protein HFF73_07170 [Oscillospiraceae bacterium]|nr:hypothetical protein [Oscillospiraceae bacterium]
MDEYRNNTAEEIGWDDEISNDTSYILLEEGDYNFRVTAFERGRFPGSAKLPPCNKAILTLEVRTSEGTASVKYDLIMCKAMEWKLCEFFCAIGQRKKGEALRPRWNEVVGSQGRARFKPRTYTKKDGGEGKSNDVEKFYDYDPTQHQLSGQQQAVWTPDNTPSRTPWDAGKF